MRAHPLEVCQLILIDIPQDFDGTLLHMPPYGLVHLQALAHISASTTAMTPPEARMA